MLLKSIIILTLLEIRCNTEETNFKKGWAGVGNPLAFARPCKGDDAVTVQYEPGLPPGEENQYYLFVSDTLPINSKVSFKFDSEATVTLVSLLRNSISIRFFY